MAEFSLELKDGIEAESESICCAECFGISQRQYYYAISNIIKINSSNPSLAEIKDYIKMYCPY